MPFYAPLLLVLLNFVWAFSPLICEVNKKFLCIQEDAPGNLSNLLSQKEKKRGSNEVIQQM